VINRFQAFTRATNRVFTVAAGVLALAIMLVILQDVFRRYLFNDPTTWALDVSSFMLCYLFFLALGPALEAGAHVQVDIVERLLPPGPRRWVGLLALAMVLGFGAVFLWKLFVAAAETFESNEVFPTATAMPVKFIWVIGPIGAAQFMLTALSLGIDLLRQDTARGGAE
jgi:TRAP-type C4-dicarboxylate transport system permease small subunit